MKTGYRSYEELKAILDELNDREVTEHTAQLLVGLVGNGVETRLDRKRGFGIAKITLSLRLPLERGATAE